MLMGTATVKIPMELAGGRSVSVAPNCIALMADQVVRKLVRSACGTHLFTTFEQKLSLLAMCWRQLATAAGTSSAAATVLTGEGLA